MLALRGSPASRPGSTASSNSVLVGTALIDGRAPLCASCYRLFARQALRQLDRGRRRLEPRGQRGHVEGRIGGDDRGDIAWIEVDHARVGGRVAFGRILLRSAVPGGRVPGSAVPGGRVPGS